ncbi:glycosyltransferase family 39 protein [Winogradskyella sp.]|uniref:glycosyltransferase family 39 protein n=1 Tax=Winogradskyella sp. TaxID=1883156 RepID=UPI003BA9D94C
MVSLNSIEHFFNSVSYKSALYFALSFITIVGVSLSFQGFDVCDEGLALTVYQQVFNCPSCVEFNFYRWFSAIVGGIWYLLFPNGGIWSFRILTVLIFLLSSFLVFKIFKDYLKPYQIALAVILSAFISDFGFLVFYHNHLTILLYLAIVYLLHRGIIQRSFWKLIIAGFLTIFCVLSRVPNLTILILTLTFFYPFFSEEHYWERKQLTLKYVLSYGLGLVIGVVFFLILANALNHQEALINSFYSTIGHGTGSSGNHSLTNLIEVYISSLAIIGIVGLKYTLIGSLFLLSYNLKYKLLRVITVVVFAFFFLRFFKGEDIYEVYFFILLSAAIFLLKKKIKLSTKLLSVMAIMIALVLPLGSDGAIRNMGYASIWLGFPFFSGVLFSMNSETIGTFYFKNKHPRWGIKRQSVLVLFILTISTYSINKVYKITNEAYFDKGNRFHKTYEINNPLANNIYTKQNRAEIINELLEALDVYVKPNDYMLVYDKMPMLHFLTKTRPYMYTPWVWVYHGEMFENQIKRAERDIDILPVVVQQKFETISKFSSPDNTYMSEGKENNNLYDRKRVKEMNAFLKRNNYEVAWFNDYFNIYVPKN